MEKMQLKKKPQLVAPAGDLEKMKIALEFGADAVYFGLPDFSLRARINKFDQEAILEASRYCKNKGKEFHLTLNIYAKQNHIKKLPAQIELIKNIRPDGVIVSDPGILSALKRELSDQTFHLSTQANATNSEAVKFWARQGIGRVILAREVSLSEMRQIRREAPKMELECFVHGAMCMAYSGRCILSKWMAGRSANLGDCAQPCRWKYRSREQNSKLKGQTEGKLGRKGHFLSAAVVDDKGEFEAGLEEDQHGTYFFNSKDLCLIRRVGDLIGCGIDCFKIEGRAKSAYYAAVTARAYRLVIDAFFDKKYDSEAVKKVIREQGGELEKLSNRGYTEAFLDGDEPEHLLEGSSIHSEWTFVGICFGGSMKNASEVIVHNKICKGDNVELVFPAGNESAKAVVIFGQDGKEVHSAHGGQGKKFGIVFSTKPKGIFLLRKRNEAGGKI